MKLVANIKLLPSIEQGKALLRTIETANRACNYISEQAWENRRFGQYALHSLVYHEVKEKFGLTAQMVVRCIAKVADAYKRDKKIQRKFKFRGSISYDDRILRYYPDRVSIWTVTGRERVPFACGEHQRQLLKNRAGESDLVYRKGQFYLNVVCDCDELPVGTPEAYLGVDLGIVNIATDSDGQHFSGKEVNGLRYRHARPRKKLQSKGTKSAKRLLKQRRTKEQNFGRHVNHCISKKLVMKAQDTQRGIALEDLKGIRTRITVRKPQRRQQHSWSFFQLRSFIEYKAKRIGVPIILVDPRNTSRSCPSCGHISKSNRPTQSQFSCVLCGLAGSADHIAAVNIRRRAEVNLPDAGTLQGVTCNTHEFIRG